jgi:hypothetical protein
MSSIFGGSKQKQTSTNSSVSDSSSSSDSRNQAYPWLQETFGGMGQTGVGANDALAALLGVGGDSAGQMAAFNNYKKGAGYQNIIDSGVSAIEGGAASRGLLNSGATAKGIARFGQDTASSFYDKYLSQLLGLSNQGLQAGSLISGAGNVSTSQSQSHATSQGSSTGNSSSKPGLGGFIGSVASAIPSDPRLKLDAVKIGENEGLGIYNYRYVWDAADAPLRTGYMADEVERLRPDALGPDLPGGYRTVNYTKLPTIH